MYWKQVLTEVLNKNIKPQNFRFTNLENVAEKQKTKIKKSARPKTYNLGEKFNNTHFSKREAECMIYILRGKTIKGVAKKLNLSPRTIEFYLKNMKRKVQCHTKPELIELVLTSDFLKNLDLNK